MLNPVANTCAASLCHKNFVPSHLTACDYSILFCMSWVGEAYEFGGANCWIGMGTRKYSKMIADSKPASKCPKMSKALFRIRWTPTPGSPGSSLCHTPSPGLEHPWRMRPSSRADIVSRAGRHQFHQLEKEVRHSAWQDLWAQKASRAKWQN